MEQIFANNKQHGFAILELSHSYQSIKPHEVEN
jgi:hypothetical protein